MYAIRTLRSQPLRLALTVGGIALCIVLMFFLLAVYRGVADGSVDYIRQNVADLWVLQQNATNILRGSSLLSEGQIDAIALTPGVRTAAPVLFLLSAIRKGDKVGTIFLTGFDPVLGLGGPPQLVRGRRPGADDEIVLDRSFARKFGFEAGQDVDLQGRRLKIVGISCGTNAFVIQYAFVTLRFARDLIGIPGLATCVLVNADPGAGLGPVREKILGRSPGLEAYDQATFLANNVREMRSGFLPLLYTVAVIGAIVLTAILSLLLSVNILERRKDFAILKTLGSPMAFLWGLVVKQAVLIASASCAAALAAFFPLVRVIERLSPEVSTKSTPGQIGGVMAAVLVMSLASSLVAIRRLRRIYFLEAFS
ncbi:MAG TPA: ABC transporter permease [Terriglobales bacterium]|nr:ABC transporter permease [Terriglobales bacterium]